MIEEARPFDLDSAPSQRELREKQANKPRLYRRVKQAQLPCAMGESCHLTGRSVPKTFSGGLQLSRIVNKPVHGQTSVGHLPELSQAPCVSWRSLPTNAQIPLR